MDRNFTALLIVILYMVLLFAFSIYGRAKQRKAMLNSSGAESFLLGGKSMGLVTVTVTVVGAAVGANGTVGIAQNAYSFGISAGWYDGAFGIGIVLTAFLFVKKLRTLNLNTISQIYGDYYGDKTRFMASAGQLLINFCITIAQYIGGGAILSSLLPQYFNMTSGMIVSFVIYVSICLIGGMFATGLTNIVNIVLLYATVIIAVILTVNDSGGWVNMVSQLPDPKLYTSLVDGLTLGVLIAYLILFLFNASCTQASTQMLFSSKDSKTAFWAFISGGLLVIPIGFGSAVIGMAGRVLFPAIENTALVFPAVVMTFPGAIAGIVLSGMWAASVSTATTLIISGSNLFMTDIYGPLAKGGKDDKKDMKLSVIISIVFALLALFCAFYVTALLSFITTFSSIVAGYFVILVATLYFPRMCKSTTAMAIMIANALILIAWIFLPAIHLVPHILYLQLGVSLILFFACYFLDSKPAYFRTSDFAEKYGCARSA